jgi:hypothetical protein
MLAAALVRLRPAKAQLREDRRKQTNQGRDQHLVSLEL